MTINNYRLLNAHKQQMEHLDVVYGFLFLNVSLCFLCVILAVCGERRRTIIFEKQMTQIDADASNHKD